MQKVFGVLAALLITLSSYAQGPPKEGPSALSHIFYQAETYRITGRSELAKEAYTKILRDNPTHETALYQLARLLFLEGYYFEAEELLKAGTANHPDNEWMWRLQAQNAKQIGNTPIALVSFERLIELQPYKPEYVQDALQSALVDKNTEKALQFLELLEERLGSSPETVQQKMEIHLRNNDLKSASEVIKNAIKNNPNRAEYRGLAAQFYDANGKRKKTEKILSQAVIDFPNNAPIAMEYARFLQSSNNVKESMYYLERALTMPGMSLTDKGPVLLSLWDTSRRDTSMQPMVNRAWAATKELHQEEGAYYLLEGERLLLEKKIQESILTYLQAVERGFNNIKVYTQIAELCKQTQQDSIAKDVLKRFKTDFGHRVEILEYIVFWYYEKQWWKDCGELAMESAPKALEDDVQKWFYNLAATAFFSQDSVDMGVKAYTYSLDIERDAAALNNLAWELGKRGLDLERALQLTQESNSKKGLEATYLDTWAWVLYKMGDYTEAQKKMALALQLQRTAPDAILYRHAAAIEKALGNEESAMEYKQKAKELEGK
jgi:tetratricopeptide (TPR) repeat protein